MTRMSSCSNALSLFPPTAFINVNHLGLSSKSCFDRKTKLIKVLSERNVFVNVCEVHVSAARAQDSLQYPQCPL